MMEDYTETVHTAEKADKMGNSVNIATDNRKHVKFSMTQFYNGK